MSDYQTSQLPDDDGKHELRLRHAFDFVIQVLQPEPYERNLIYVPFCVADHDLKAVQGFLGYHHVIPEHRKLIISLYRAEVQATKAEIIGIAQPGRIYRVRCTKPTDVTNANRL